MKFVYFSNLTSAAKKAFNSGKSNSKFAVDSDFIAVKDENGRAKDFVKVIKTKGKDISSND
jgi:hypothetical protein